MSYLIIDILKTSIVISFPIILIALLKNKVLSKYTYKLNYIFCILITLRMLFISNIEVYLPFEFLKKKNDVNLKSVNYISGENNNAVDYIKTIFFIWLIGAIYVVIRNTYKQIVFYKKIENITYKVTEDNIIKSLEEEKKYLNIKKDIEVLKVNGLSSPALIGIIKNKIVIPNKDYDTQQLKWIFRHELTHFKRKDNLLKLILMISCSIHWFNPLVKILKVYFEEQCELSCDERVVTRFDENDIKEYSLVLVDTLRYRNTLKATVFSSQFNTNEINLIKRRVEGMLSLKKRKKGTIMAIIVFSISVFSILSFNEVKGVDEVYANESISHEKNNEDSNVEANKSYKDLTDEEILMNFENNENQGTISLYEDKKSKDLTQEERDHALNLLFSGKYSKVYVGSDGTMSINLEHLKSKVNKMQSN
ncbi:M56 family metallopeptidase [Paraclostridium sordellii]|uniref:M56 family metallopeptidase n=2 Tax=Paraclostridium sordellii TaxID=1505 RepID=UPI0005E05BF7|nr:M56 family metallopeptidase [Paeniclostridium sordellii]CEN93594.1 beta-lactamase inducer [[Clostridium] sordellii] [Paeniclostridium sordellii]CEN94675.1 beta-lactamase inducer [[Clostridium] sordellii] [Paeniclostridium sordellii]